MEISFQCTQKDFPQIETFLFAQEYESQPGFNRIKLTVNKEEFLYGIENQFGKWYITTNIN